MSRYKLWLLIGAAFGGLAVVTGAFGAHGLETALAKRRELDSALTEATVAHLLAVWETAARYQMYHAFGLLAVGFVACRRCGWAVHLAGAAMTLGTLMFSGGLYALVLSDQRWLIAVVPIGGVLMIAGWLLLATAIARLDSGTNCNVEPRA